MRRLLGSFGLLIAFAAASCGGGCATVTTEPPAPRSAPIRMDVSAVRQGVDAVLVEVELLEPGGAPIASPKVAARIGEPASIEISGDPTISIRVTSREEGRLASVEVEGLIRYADGREARPIATLSVGWGLPSASGR